MSLVVASAIDWSWDRPDPRVVKSLGYWAVGRYLANDGRGLSIAERDAIYAAGLRLFVIGQRGAATRPRSGYAGGRLDGEFFQAEADELNWPNHKPILCAIADVGDGFPTRQDLPAIKEYFRGIKDTNRRPIGIYGPYWVLEDFRGDPRVFCFWQTAGDSGSGTGTGGSAFNPGDGSWRRLSSLACMYQQHGGVLVGVTDHNQVYEADLRWTHHPSDANPASPRRGKKNDMTIFQIAETRDDSVWAEQVFFPTLEAAPESRRHTFLIWDGFVRHIENVEELDGWKIGLYAEALENNKNPDPFYKPSIIFHPEPIEDRWFRMRTLVPHDQAGFDLPI